jgi:serine phosphatase RsbU (regulator of sigma subunit)
MRLSSLDTILLYTDGLTEAENAEGQRWGERRLIKSLALIGPGTPQDVIESLVKEFKTFSPSKPKDDITIVAMKVMA